MHPKLVTKLDLEDLFRDLEVTGKVKLSLYLTNQALRQEDSWLVGGRGLDVYIHVFLTSALVGELSASRTGRFILGEGAPGAPWTGGWVGPRADLDDMEKLKFLILLGLVLRPLDRLTQSQLIYRLRYRSS
jgi:hypothetical protein